MVRSPSGTVHTYASTAEFKQSSMKQNITPIISRPMPAVDVARPGSYSVPRDSH